MAHYLEKLGADRKKMVMGMAFFGRGFTLLNREKNGIGANVTGPSHEFGSTKTSGFFAYYEVPHLN